jgi:hypothetical protein
MGGVAYGLRRLSKGAQEASAHPLTVAKAGFLGDFLDRQPSLLEHISCSLEAKILDGAGRRLTGFCAEHPGELPGAEPSGLRELLNGQGLSKLRAGLLRLAWERPTKRSRHHVAIDFSTISGLLTRNWSRAAMT